MKNKDLLNSVKTSWRALPIMALIVSLPLITGCQPLIKSYPTTQKTNSCEKVKPLAFGQQGAFTAFDLVNCYDWVIVSREQFNELSE